MEFLKAIAAHTEDKDATIAFLKGEVNRLQGRVSELGGMLSTEQWETIADDGGPDAMAVWREWRDRVRKNPDLHDEIARLQSRVSELGAQLAEANSWQNTHRSKTIPKGRT